ncbi:hypothetical protein NMT79_25720, partial [Escherichia coli]|nr:hypothetical protein [Escherichia coli]
SRTKQCLSVQGINGHGEPGRETVRRIITLCFERMAMRLRDSSQATVFLDSVAAKALCCKGLREMPEAVG